MTEATFYQAQPATTSTRRGAPLEFIALAAALTVFIVLRLVALAQYPLDNDEVFSMRIARLGWSALFDKAARDVSHPPLFYVLLKLWMGLGGQSLAWVRALPAVIGILACVPMIAAGRALALRTRELALAGLLVGVNGFLVFYAHHLRMFVLLELTSALALWRLARFVDSGRPRDLAWLTLANLAAVYSHYWGFVLIATEAVILLVAARRRLLAFLASCAPVGAAYVPWLWAIWRAIRARGEAVSQISWITVPKVADLQWFYVSLIGELRTLHSRIGLVFFLAPLAYWLVVVSRRGSHTERRTAVILVALAFLPVVVTFALSWILPESVWAPRQLILSAIPFLLLVATATLRVPVRALRVTLVVFQVAWSCSAGVAAVTRPNAKLPWDTLAQQIEAGEVATTGTVPVYTFEIFVRDTLSYQLEELHAKRLPVVMVSSLDMMAGAPRFWVVYRDTTWKFPFTPEAWLEAHGYDVGIPKSIAMEGLQRITALPVRCDGCRPATGDTEVR